MRFIILSFALSLSIHLCNHVVGGDVEPLVLVHGGAGSIGADRIPGKYRGSKLAARVGYRTLIDGGSPLDAVEEAIRVMESDSYFNAGYGSVLNRDGVVEMDASIMDGSALKAGCVAGVQDVLHPISLARRVMENSKHNFLAGEGMINFTVSQGIEILFPKGQLVSPYSKEIWEQWKENNPLRSSGEGGTVGAVAIDQYGNIAAATSTGGLTGKLPGRVGDTPIIGAGTYADNAVGGISLTGDGDEIMKVPVAYDIAKRMEYLGIDMQTAAEDSLRAMNDRLGGTGGAIGVDPQGEVMIAFNSEQMSWAYQRGNILAYGVREGEHIEENLSDEEQGMQDMFDSPEDVFG